MKAWATDRTTGLGLMAITVAVYFSRPWSCGYALSQFVPDDAVPYSDFDYHGWGVMFAWLAALIFAVPVLWLASNIFLSPGSGVGVLGRAADGRTTFLSIVVALALGAPMHSQIAYFIGLPIWSVAPVLVTSLFWLLVVEVGRTVAVRNERLRRGVGRPAIILALLITVPKLALVVMWILG